MFIAFEGIEGSGKTTLVNRLESELRSMIKDLVITREPGGTPISNKIRTLLLDPENKDMTPGTELLLYAAARAQHVDTVLRPAQERGALILCDRYTWSTRAYQGGGRQLSDIRVLNTIQIATNGLTPDFTFLLDLPAEIGLSRAKSRSKKDRIENEDLLFHSRVRNTFLEIQKDCMNSCLINASNSEDEVFSEILQKVLFLHAAA